MNKQTNEKCSSLSSRGSAAPQRAVASPSLQLTSEQFFFVFNGLILLDGNCHPISVQFHFLSNERSFVAWAGIINTKNPAKFTTLSSSRCRALF